MKTKYYYLCLLPFLLLSEITLGFERLECEFDKLNESFPNDSRTLKVSDELTINSNLMTVIHSDRLSVSFNRDKWTVLTQPAERIQRLINSIDMVLTLAPAKPAHFFNMNGLVFATLTSSNAISVESYFGTCQAEAQIN